MELGSEALQKGGAPAQTQPARDFQNLPACCPTQTCCRRKPTPELLKRDHDLIGTGSLKEDFGDQGVKKALFSPPWVRGKISIAPANQDATSTLERSAKRFG